MPSTESGPEPVVYDTAFFEENDPGSLRSARVILEIVLDLVRPKSVVDVGCGTGTWLSVCWDAGIHDVLGIDGAYVDRSRLRVPPGAFVAHDLASPFEIDRRFDMAMSLEVAEHLEQDRAEEFVDALVALAPVVLFSAAAPLQSGVNHVNCRWCDYWASLFDARGYGVADPVRLVVWNDDRVDYWYAQNTLLYVSRTHMDADPDLSARLSLLRESPLNLVHPALLDQFVEPGIRWSLSTLRGATLRRLRRERSRFLSSRSP